MPEVTFRQATAADLPVIADMHVKLDASSRQLTYRFPKVENMRQVWLESFQRTLGRFSVVFVAELDDAIVGFMLGRIKHAPRHMGGVLVGELSEMWVEPEARRQGIGKQLTRLAMEWLRGQGVHSLEIEILEGNQSSWKLFEGLGFKPELRQSRLVLDKEQA